MTDSNFTDLSAPVSTSPSTLLHELALGPSSAGVDGLLAALHQQTVRDFCGVLHLTAVWSPPMPGSQLTVMKINAATPKSELDFFLLNAARAWADVVFTTGKILREEPELRFELQGHGSAALGKWRHEIEAGRDEYPRLLVLTSGRGLDLAHGVFSACRRGEQGVVFITGTETKRELEHLVESSGTELMSVVALESARARDVVEWAKKRGLRRISVEAGPSTALELYQTPIAVDRLWLSRYLGSTLPNEAKGAAFLPMASATRGSARSRTSGHRGEEWAFSSIDMSVNSA